MGPRDRPATRDEVLAEPSAPYDEVLKELDQFLAQSAAEYKAMTGRLRKQLAEELARLRNENGGSDAGYA